MSSDPAETARLSRHPGSVEDSVGSFEPDTAAKTVSALPKTCNHDGKSQPDAMPLDMAQQIARRLADRWTYPILVALRPGPMRFANLKRTLDPITQRMLTLSLRNLEREALVFRQETSGCGQYVSYGLTPFGQALIARLIDFGRWLTVARPALNRDEPTSFLGTATPD